MWYKIWLSSSSSRSVLTYEYSETPIDDDHLSDLAHYYDKTIGPGGASLESEAIAFPPEEWLNEKLRRTSEEIHSLMREKNFFRDQIEKHYSTSEGF